MLWLGTELAASPVRNELIPQNELSVVPPDLDGNSVCAACRALISWNTCLTAVAKIHCPVLTAVEWRVLSLGQGGFYSWHCPAELMQSL